MDPAFAYRTHAHQRTYCWFEAGFISFLEAFWAPIIIERYVQYHPFSLIPRVEMARAIG